MLDLIARDSYLIWYCHFESSFFITVTFILYSFPIHTSTMNNSPAALTFALNTAQWEPRLQAEAHAVRVLAGVQEITGPSVTQQVQERSTRVFQPSNHMSHGALRSAIASLVLLLPDVVSASDASTRQASWSRMVKGVSVAVGAEDEAGGIRAVILKTLAGAKDKIFEMIITSNSLDQVVKIIVSPSDIDSR